MFTSQLNVQSHKVVVDALSGLGRLLDYPRETLPTEVEEWRRRFSPEFPKAGAFVSDFQSAALKLRAGALEEIYTRTFDIAPMCNPYVTAHLYGDENFERGTLMTKLAERYKAEDFNTFGELPDHLRVILLFAPYFSHEEMVELTQYCLLGPVKAMLESLNDQQNPYNSLLQAVQLLLQQVN